ncbi:MAG TPA: DUF3618 domain-containing protein [Sphingomicrobium sp.]|nr:DUF3618 domain-containing protein [Sphingomicrobium sp.]
MRDTPEIIAARSEVERSRSRLMATVHELQERINPKTLARNTWQGAKEKGADLAENTVDVVKSRPLAATGVVAAVTMFLAREPLIDLAAKVVGRGKKKPASSRKTKVNDTENA